jgi:hypothetical protein
MAGLPAGSVHQWPLSADTPLAPEEGSLDSGNGNERLVSERRRDRVRMHQSPKEERLGRFMPSPL